MQKLKELIKRKSVTNKEHNVEMSGDSARWLDRLASQSNSKLIPN